MTSECDAETMAALIEAMADDPGGQIPRLADLIAAYPEDARLRFLHGSALIGEKRLIEAHASLSEAVRLAPDFAIARFQLGFFQLTSGEAEAALETWGRLDRLGDGHYLRKFVDGLRCLIRDEFQGAIDRLREGIGLNKENPPLNRDMQLLIDECAKLLAGGAREDDEAVSETALILKQFSNRGPLH